MSRQKLNTAMGRDVGPACETVQKSLPLAFLPSLKCLRAFVAVAHAESISSAAAELNLSQSAVTQSVARLEHELDVHLLDRRSTGSYLTETGDILLDYTATLYRDIEAAIAECVGRQAPDRAATGRAARRLTNAQIVALVAIKDSGSFFQAARRIGVAQPSVQRAARAVEQALGVTLFNTTARGVTLNDPGYRLANRLHLAARTFEGAYEQIEAQKLRERGRILVGGLLLAGSGFLASAISAFSRMHPGVHVNVATASYDVLLNKLRAGSIDFIVGMTKSPPPADDVIEEVLAPDPYVVAARQDHPLVGRQDVSRSDLAKFEWIMPGWGTGRHIIFERLFDTGGKGPSSSIETYSPTVLTMLLTESDRMTILTESQIMVDRSLSNSLAKVDCSLPEYEAYLGVTMRREWTPSAVQASFLDFLRHGPMTSQLQARARS